jgi:hypothetical protein
LLVSKEVDAFMRDDLSGRKILVRAIRSLPPEHMKTEPGKRLRKSPGQLNARNPNANVETL